MNDGRDKVQLKDLDSPIQFLNTGGACNWSSVGKPKECIIVRLYTSPKSKSKEIGKEKTFLVCHSKQETGIIVKISFHFILRSFWCTYRKPVVSNTGTRKGLILYNILYSDSCHKNG